MPRSHPCSLDTCTKFLAPGLRLGWAVAAPAVIEKMTNLLQGQTLGPSGISQVGQGCVQTSTGPQQNSRARCGAIACAPTVAAQVVAHTLLEAWGEGGLDLHLRLLQVRIPGSPLLVLVAPVLL